MPRPLAQSVLDLIDGLLCRYDGPVPPAGLLEAQVGEPAPLLGQRAISREIDRAALRTQRTVASHRRRLPASALSTRHRSALDELSLGLAHYRELGLHFAAS